MRKALVALTLMAVSIGGLMIGENSAHTYLDTKFVDMVGSTFPNAYIDHTDVRGQPYLISRFDEAVSTGYAYLYPGEDGSDRIVLVQNLDLNTGRTQRIRTFVTVPYPSGLPEPKLDTTANRSQALFGTDLVTYGAELNGSTVTFNIAESDVDTSRFVPAPTSVPTTVADGSLAAGSQITRVVPKDDGLLVEVTSEGTQLTIDHLPSNG